MFHPTPSAEEPYGFDFDPQLVCGGFGRRRDLGMGLSFSLLITRTMTGRSSGYECLSYQC
jgi:hypothetical protein